MTAIFLPRTSSRECTSLGATTRPPAASKASRPANSGIFGSEKMPFATTTKSKVSVVSSPESTLRLVTVHAPSDASGPDLRGAPSTRLADVTSVPRRSFSFNPCSVT